MGIAGGAPDDDVDLAARTPEGEPVIDDAPDDAGLMFVCFQKDVRTFVATQHRLDELDALAAYSTPTASGAFLILPGFDAERPLGSTLRSTP